MVQEIWFEKSGSRKVVDQKKGGFIPLIQIFSGWRKVVDQKKKNPSLKNHFSRTTFLEPLFYTFPEMRSQNKRSHGLSGEKP